MPPTSLQLAYGIEAPFCAAILGWFTEFKRRQNSFLDVEHSGRYSSAVVQKIVAAVWKMLISDNHCIC